MESRVRKRSAAPSAFWAAVHGGLGRAGRPRGVASFGVPPSTSCSGVDCQRPRPTKGRQEPAGSCSWTAGSNPHSRRARPLRCCPRPDGAAYKSRDRLAPVVLRAAMAGRSRSSCTCEMTHPGKPGTGGRPRQRPGAPPVCHPSRRKARPEKGRTQCPSRRNENRRRSRASCPQSSGSASQVAEDAVHRARARLVRFNSHGLPVCCARAFRPTAATECCLTSPARVATLRAWSFEPTGLQPR
jgi:hypothetical protein